VSSDHGTPSDGFESVVAGWRREGGVPQWPDFEGPPDTDGDPPVERSPGSDAAAAADGWAPDGWDEGDDAAGAAAAAPGGDDGGVRDAPVDRRRAEDGGAARDTDDANSAGRGHAGPAGRTRDRPGTEPGDGQTSGSRAGEDDPGRGRRVTGSGQTGASRSGRFLGNAGRGIERGPAADPLDDDDDHFVPGEPPPLPRLTLPFAIGLMLLALGAVLIWAPGWVGVPQVYGLPLGLVSMAAGLGWLVLRLWPDPDGAGPPLGHDPDDPDDGAIV
jgi:hypothetical protein